jgi:hypothetical protein
MAGTPISTRNRFQLRGLAALAIVALLLLGATRDAGATQKGVGTQVMTAAVIACQAMGGTATVDSGFDSMSVDNMSPVILMRCTGGKLDGFTCDGTGDSVKCGSIKLAVGGTGPVRPPVAAVVLRPAADAATELPPVAAVATAPAPQTSAAVVPTAVADEER